MDVCADAPLVDVEIYFSYDPNARSRFWNKATAQHVNDSWAASMQVYDRLPLYVFALCRYRLDHPVALERGKTSTVVLNSIERAIVPDSVDLKSLATIPKTRTPFENFQNGIQDWSTRDHRTIKTYKFQSPDLDRSKNKSLVLTVDPQGKRLTLHLRVESTHLDRKDNIGRFSFTTQLDDQVPQEIVVRAEDFSSPKDKTLEWSKIETFEVTIVDQETGDKVDLTSKAGQTVLQRIELVD